MWFLTFMKVEKVTQYIGLCTLDRSFLYVKRPKKLYIIGCLTLISKKKRKPKTLLFHQKQFVFSMRRNFNRVLILSR